MTKPLRFTVPGRPISWKRPNLVDGRYLEPEGQAAAKMRVAWEARRAMGKRRPLEGPVALLVECYQRRKPDAVPDHDNLGKMPSDALNGVAYVDDAQVVDGRSVKVDCRVAGGEPRTVVTVTPVRWAEEGWVPR